MQTVLAAVGLRKVFETHFGRQTMTAVEDLSFDVGRGDIFGFLGPNGAGKSTTIRMILGLIHPSAGRVEISGHDVQKDRRRALMKVGAFVETPSFYPFLTGRKNLEIFSGLSGGVPSGELDRVIELVGLHGRDGDLVKVYSHGMKQRLGLAACLLPRPELLVLDEPTDGLDPHGIRATCDLIIRLARDTGLTIFLSSHLLSEVENLCNRVAILDKGRVILSGEMRDLEREHRRLEMKVSDPLSAARVLHERFFLDAKIVGSSLVLKQPSQNAGQLNAALVESGITVERIAPENFWLDRVFLDLTTARL